MATRTSLECPVCHEEINHDEQLEGHLYNEHSKRALAGFVATEAVALEEDDISE